MPIALRRLKNTSTSVFGSWSSNYFSGSKSCQYRITGVNDWRGAVNRRLLVPCCICGKRGYSTHAAINVEFERSEGPADDVEDDAKDKKTSPEIKKPQQAMTMADLRSSNNQKKLYWRSITGVNDWRGAVNRRLLVPCCICGKRGYSTNCASEVEEYEHQRLWLLVKQLFQRQQELPVPNVDGKFQLCPRPAPFGMCELDTGKFRLKEEQTIG
jgi:hypothetical protein